MQKSQSHGPERQMDPMEKARNSANNARENLNKMPDNRTNQVNNNLNGCWLNTRCQQVGNGNINVWEVNNMPNQYANNNINQAKQYAHWWPNVHVNTYQQGVRASWSGASNSVWQIGWS